MMLLVVVVGEGGGTTAGPVAMATAVVIVVEVFVVVTAVPAAAVVVTAGVGPGGEGALGGWVDGLDGDLGAGLGGGVEGLGARVVLGAQLHGGLHGDLGLLGETVAAVGWRRGDVGGRGGAVGRGWAVTAGPLGPALQVGLGVDLDHPVGTGTAKGPGEKEGGEMSLGGWSQEC